MKWNFKQKVDAESLSSQLGIDPVLGQLLVQRGIDTFEKARLFFNPDISALHNPYLMKDMDKAVARIKEALQKNQRVLVFGDYDVDGTTSVALMCSFLESLDMDLLPYIPDRYQEGYGVSQKGIDFAKEQGVSLIIALDCGVKSVDLVDYASSLDMDFIICDHHRPGTVLPDAVAVLDPKREDCDYPYKELSGCGVGFKLCQALQEDLQLDFTDLINLLDFCAISIGADLVAVDGENRILAHHGLVVLNQRKRPGLAALMAQSDHKNFSLTDVIFTIGPKINAAGRMKHGLYAVELLLESDLQKAIAKAEDINAFNAERRDADQTISKEALELIEQDGEQQDAATVVFQQHWHKGVIGIVASRLIDTYYRPTLVFTKSGEYLAASARSVTGFDVYNAIDSCSDLLVQFGGHKYAAGLTIKPENFKAFKAKFNQIVSETITDIQKIREVDIDAQLPFASIDDKFYRILGRMEPFGPSNERPVFVSVGLRETGYAKAVGDDGKHLKLQLKDESVDKTYNAIGFGLGDQLPHCIGLLDVVYELDKNSFRGQENFQLMLKDVKEHPDQ